MHFKAGINIFLDRHEKNVFPSWNHLFENMQRTRFQAGINYFRTTCKECVSKLESIISEGGLCLLYLNVKGLVCQGFGLLDGGIQGYSVDSGIASFTLCQGSSASRIREGLCMCVRRVLRLCCACGVFGHLGHALQVWICGTGPSLSCGALWGVSCVGGAVDLRYAIKWGMRGMRGM
jgi:hypothetical protein